MNLSLPTYVHCVPFECPRGSPRGPRPHPRRSLRVRILTYLCLQGIWGTYDKSPPPIRVASSRAINEIMYIGIMSRISLHWLIGYLECGVAHSPGSVPCAVGLCAVGRPPAIRSNTECRTHPIPNTARPIPNTAVLNTEYCANTEAMPRPIWAEYRTECSEPGYNTEAILRYCLSSDQDQGFGYC